MVTPLLLLAGLACGPGPVDLSTVTDTRVIAIQGAPPEVRPGESTRITATIANPMQHELEALVWTCIPWEGACLGDDSGDLLPSQATISQVIGGSVSTIRSVPAFPSDIPSDVLEAFIDAGLAEDGDLEAIPVQVSVLACPVGTCDLIRDVDAELLLEGSSRGTVAADLANPSDSLKDEPIEGVSLATKTLRIARPDAEGTNDNPIVEARWLSAADEVLQLDEDVPYELTFHVEDPENDKVYAYGYTTLGRFIDRKEKVDDDAVRLFLLPEDSGTGEVWVVFEDDDGGTTVWHRDIRVR